jgi:VWFA-related protein
MTVSFQIDRFSLAAAAIVVCALLFGAFSVRAQDEDDIQKIETDLASFEVTVSDKNGDPIRNLSQSDFRVFEDGVERPIDFFQPIKKQDEGRPLSVIFALDLSGSMTPAEIERLRQAMQNFIRRLADYNSYFAVMTFAMEVKVVRQFTNKPEELERSFDRLDRDQSGLSTHAYDAVDDAIRLLVRKSPKTIKNRIPKRAVILITDGFPVGDVVRPSTVIERANAAEASVYSVILPSYSRLQGEKRPVLTPLEASGLIDRTGGKSLYATDRNFEPLFASLAEEITSSYAIAIYPSESARDGKPRNVRIESRKGFLLKQNRTSYTLGQKHER